MESSNSSLYAAMLIVAAIVDMVAIGVSLPRRKAQGAGALIVLLCGLALWSLAYAFHWLSYAPEGRYFWLNMTYLGVVMVPPAMFIFACRYTGRDGWLTRPRLALFLIEPIATLILVWTDLHYGWFFAGKRALTASVLFDGSPLFWVHVVYSYGLMLIATVILVNYAVRSLRFYQWQIGTFVGSLLLPWAVNILSITGSSPFSDLDLTPIVFTFTGVVILYDMVGHRLLDILPIARDLLIENMDEGVVVVDNNYRVVDFNSSAQKLFSGTHEIKIGQLVTPLLARWPELVEKYLTDDQWAMEVVLQAAQPAYLEIRVQPIRDQRGGLLGRLIIWRNVSVRKSVELALQNANQQLQARVWDVETLQEQLREQSIRDALTGTYNRRYLDETLEREFQRAQREEEPLAVTIMDLDSFKSVNDRYGHRAGDVALKQIADFLSAHTRAGDIVCRYGGEEFVIVMPGLDVETALARAEHWRSSIESMSIESQRGIFHLTASIGIAVYPTHADNAEDLLHAADDALYEAKAGGKNMVVVYTSSLPA